MVARRLCHALDEYKGIFIDLRGQNLPRAKTCQRALTVQGQILPAMMGCKRPGHFQRPLAM